MKNAFGAVAALLLFIATGSVGAQEGVTKDTIYLGTSLPSTGPVAPACMPQNDGAQAWFKQVNAGGGIHGRKIENIVLDDGYKAPEALANARELVAKPIFAFFSGCGSIQPPGIIPLAQQNGIPYLYPNAGTPELMTAKISFALLPTYGQLFENLIHHLIKKDGGKARVYAVLADVPGAQQAIDGLTRAANEAGGEFVGSVVMNPAATDYTPVVLKIKDTRPDYVATNLSGGAAARLFNAMAANNAYPAKSVIGSPVHATGSFMQPVGAAANGKILIGVPIVSPTDPRAKSCIEAINKYYPNLPIDFASLFGCAVAQVTTTALSELGPNPTRAGLIKVLESWRGKVASQLFPPISFGGANRLGISSMFYVGIADQKLVPVGEYPLLPSGR